MADEIRLVTYANQQVTPQNDAVLTNLEILNNGIIFGCEVTIKNASTLHINSGMGVIYGREFEIVDSDISVPLPGAGTKLGQLYIHIDLANTSAPVELLIETGASLTPMVDDANLNVTTGITEYQLATFNVSAATISDLVVTFENTKNIRTELGTADISGIGDGSVKGAISRINSDLTNNTCVNLLNPTAQTQTINGVKFTNNGDGTYTVNGTASKWTFVNLNYVNKSTLSVPVGTYKLTGTPSNNVGASLEVVSQESSYGRDTGSGGIVTVPQDTTASWARIVIQNGTTCDNLLFKPMLTTDLNAKYSDYVPYTGDSGRLNEDVSNKQDKTDNALTTTAKTIVGAINEINSDLSDYTKDFETLSEMVAFTNFNIALPQNITTGSKVRILIHEGSTDIWFTKELICGVDFFMNQPAIRIFSVGGYYVNSNTCGSCFVQITANGRLQRNSIQLNGVDKSATTTIACVLFRA